MKFASSEANPTKASKNLEFLRINLEFLYSVIAGLAKQSI